MRRLKIADLVMIEWRDSFSEHDQSSLDKLPKDCRWSSVGWVVRMTDTFVTIAGGVELTTVSREEKFDNLLSIPWTQVLDYKKVG